MLLSFGDRTEAASWARILVAEDDVNQAEPVRRYLEHEGRRRGPGLLILDVMMPRVDGLDVCRVLRAEKSRSRSTGGSGLHLAITRQVVRARDGTVSVASEPGNGSTFRVLMPVRCSM